jgi:ABC-2 type transport system ATP-binding protein
VHAVDGLDLDVRTGEIYGFLGVNGAGKTTAIRLLMGIIKADAGVIEILGEQTRRTTIRQKQSIGYVSQEQTFYPWMTCRMLGQFVGGLYPTWDAAEFDRLLRVLDLPPDRKASQLSCGMRVKLALALALAPRPALLILDEPTSGLDPLARREFLNIIRQQAREHGRTTLFSSHIIGEIERVADRVGIIHRGRMCYEGSLDELQASIRMVQEPLAVIVDKPPAVSAPPPLAVAPPPAMEASAVESALTCKTIAPRAMPGEIPPVIPSSSVSAGPAGELPLTPALSPSERGEGEDSAAPVPAPWTPPPGFRVLQDEIHDGFRSRVMRATPAEWESVSANGLEIRRLSVEDIFVALVGKGAIVS